MNDNYMYNKNYQTYEENQTKTKKTLLYIIIILLLCIIIGVVGILLFTNTKKSYSRTVMIYMVGSDLESKGGFGTIDLDAIDYATTKANNMNILLIAGGSTKWHNDYIDKSQTSIYRLEEDGFKKVKEQDKVSMGKSNTLSDFMNYVYDNYKTDKYELILWNHGGAIDGSEYDSLYKNDNLTLQELGEALDNSPFNAQNKLELVFFNTCLNGTIEVANVFKNYTDYLVASEEVTWGTIYASEFKFLNGILPEDNEVEIGKKFISAYKEKIQTLRENHLDDDNAIYSTYSLIKMSKVDELVKSVSDLFGDINVSKNFETLSKTRANSFQYGTDHDEYDMVDLYNYVDEIKEISPAKAQKVLDLIDKTVIYNWATDKRSRGLSIYFPYKADPGIIKRFLKVYKDIEELSSYNKFINTFNTIKEEGYTGKITYAKNEIGINTNEKTKEADFEIELTDEQLKNYASAEYVVYQDKKNGFYKAAYKGKNTQLNGNKLTTNIRDRQLRVVSKNDPTDGLTLLSIETDENDNYIKYETIVTLQNIDPNDITNWTHDIGTMKLLYDKKSKKVEMLGIVYNDEIVSGSFVDLSKYNNVVFSGSSGWKILDENGNYTGPQYDENGKVIGDGVITGFEEKPGQFDFEIEKFDENEDYYAVFILTDIYGNKSYTKLVKMN